MLFQVSLYFNWRVYTFTWINTTLYILAQFWPDSILSILSTQRERESSPPSIGAAKLLLQLRPGHTDYEYRISVFTDKHSLPNTDIIRRKHRSEYKNTNIKTSIQYTSPSLGFLMEKNFWHYKYTITIQYNPRLFKSILAITNWSGNKACYEIN